MTYLWKQGFKGILVLVITVLSQSAVAELSLNDSPTPGEFSAVLRGPGLQLENLRFIKGVKGQYGTFVGGNDSVTGGNNLGIPDGIYLSTGNKNSIAGPNNTDKFTYNTNVQYGDPDLMGITANAIYDPVILEFDLIPEGDKLNFLLVFGSEEYPEYVCSKFNDAFGLFVSGPGINGTSNAARVPGSNAPIAVNNINNGLRGSAADGTACDLSHSIYFVDNGNGTGAAGTQMDGFTRPVTASIGDLQAGQRYRIKLALADAGDQAYDSAAFFKWLTSTSSAEVDLALSALPSTLKPAKNGLLDIRYTVTNTSTTGTKGVAVGIDLPPGVISIADSGGGTFDSAEGIWRVGDMDGGVSKTLDLRISVGEAISYTIPAEIQYAFNEDPDSTPYNHLSLPLEDDTAILVLKPEHNNPPLITNANSAETFSISVLENTTAVIVSLDAKDVDGDSEGAGLIWVLSGGHDARHFTLDVSGGLRFIRPPDYENPLDHNKDNQYQVEVKVCDSAAECDVQTITVWVSDLLDEQDSAPAENRAPTITNNGSAPSTRLTYPENATTVIIDLDAQDEDGDTENSGLVWSISGGADEERFTLDARGKLRFIVAPDFEQPLDEGIDNQYEVEVSVCDSSAACDTQSITVEVTDLADASVKNPPTILNNASAATAALSYNENAVVAVIEMDAEDQDGDTEGAGLVWVISGGSDERLFAFDSQGGLHFIQSPNYEKPADADNDNQYQVEVRVCDSTTMCDVQMLTVTVADVAEDPAAENNQPPRILNNDGSLAINLSFEENSTQPVVDLNAEDTEGDTEGSGLSWSTFGGSDEAQFVIDSRGGLRFILPPDYEKPVDHDKNNQYEIKVKVCDRFNACDAQTIIVTVVDLAEDFDGDGVPAGVELAIGSDPNKADTDGDGIDDREEIGLDYLNPRDTDGDRVPDVLDDDDDGDGILTKDENYNAGTPADDDTDGDAVPDYRDVDDDGDGVLTRYENYNGGLPTDDDTDKDDVPDYLDTDDDNDGLLTKNEQADPNNDGNPTDAVDTEGDGLVDYLDFNNATAPGDDDDGDGIDNQTEIELGSDPNDSDSDNDGIPDGKEMDENGDPLDSDNDGIPDFRDQDDDNDGILNIDEAHDGKSVADTDTDNDGVPNYLDHDDDNDSILTKLEDYNGNGPTDEDSDGDGMPDYLDTDDDGDGVITWLENYNGALPLDDDTDGDGIVDYLDTDDDGDGLLTINESPDPNQNGNPDDALDYDQDGKKNYIDADDDDDGILTKDEMPDPNGDGDPADAVDADLDGLVDYMDSEFSPFIRVKLRAMLQGAYDLRAKQMHTKLRDSGYLPTEQPYSSLENSFGYGSVGNVTPFGYQGEGVMSDAVFRAEEGDAVVDWILVEIRASADPTRILSSTAALIQADGDIVVAETGSDSLVLSGVGEGNHYIAIRHRNHLGVMTATPVPLKPDESITYDFADPDLPVYGKIPRSMMSSDHALMWSGDLNNSGSIISEGPGSDLTVLLGSVLVAPANKKANANYPLAGYYASDLNMDGKTIYSGPSNDSNLLIGNVLLHPDNTDYISNFVVKGSLP